MSKANSIYLKNFPRGLNSTSPTMSNIDNASAVFFFFFWLLPTLYVVVSCNFLFGAKMSRVFSGLRLMWGDLE